MFEPKMLDDLAKKLSDAMPAGLQQLQGDLEQTFRGVLQSGLSKLDLVTREEFDVQTQVLARTRQKVEALEEKLSKLEEALKPASDN